MVVGTISYKLITCLLYHAGGVHLLKALLEKGLASANLHHARGAHIGAQSDRTGLPPMVQTEILTVMVAEEQAEEIFEFIYVQGKIGEINQGFLYMETLNLGKMLMLPTV
jgi:hypothetical protein